MAGIEIPPAPAVGCEVAGQAWSGTLSMRENLPFAVVRRARVAVTLASPPTAHVTVDASLRINALVERPDVHVAAPTLLGGFIVPKAETALTWGAVATADRVPITVAIGDTFESPPAVTAELPCDALTMDVPSYDARARAIAGSGRVVATAGTDISLEGPAAFSATPGGEVIATLTSKWAVEASLLESRGSARRVVLEGAGYWASGWVDARFVRPAGSRGMRGGGGEAFVFPVGGRSTCGHDLPVFALVETQRAHVGKLNAGALFRQVDAAPVRLEDGWAAIEPDDPTVTHLFGARWVVRIEDLATCSPPP